MGHEVIAAVQDPVDSANRAAMEAVEIYLTARGLLELIDTFRFRELGSPIPAPGTADLTDEIRTDVLEAMHAVATCRIVAKTTGTHPQTEGRDAIDAARARSWDARHRASDRLLRLAEVGLGVAQHAYEDDEVELLERAAIGVLVGPHCSTTRELSFALTGSTAEELSVEFAGMIARLLCDPVPGSGFVVSDGDGTTNLLTIQLTPGAELTVTAGYPGRAPSADRVLPPDGKVSRTVRSPVVITEVTASMLDSLRGWDVDLAGLHVEWLAWRQGPSCP